MAQVFKDAIDEFVEENICNGEEAAAIKENRAQGALLQADNQIYAKNEDVSGPQRVTTLEKRNLMLQKALATASIQHAREIARMQREIQDLRKEVVELRKGGEGIQSYS